MILGGFIEEEHGTEPELRYMPKIIEFLGYVPFECPAVCTIWCIPEQLMDWLNKFLM